MALNMLARITKVDEARREVWGRLAQEVPDKSGEIWDYESSLPHFMEWSKAFSDATDGKSLGNLRAMHGKVAAGKFIAVTPVPADKAIDVGAKVVDDNEWKKVMEGVYTGFSIGGSYVEGSRKTEKIDGQDFVRYTAKPAEGSLVDNPCIPTAKFFDIIKADGVVVKTEFKAPDLEVAGTDDEVAEFAKLMKDGGLSMADAIKAVKSISTAKATEDALLETIADMEKREFNADERKQAAKTGAAMPDGSFPIHTVADLKNAVRAYGRAKDKEAAKAHIIKRAKALKATDELPEDWMKDGKKAVGGKLAKGMYSVQDLAGCLAMLAGIARSAEWEAQEEEDDSPIPAKLRNAVDDLMEVFKEMAAEEADELLAELKTHAKVGEDDDIESAVEMAVRMGALNKQLTSPDLPIAELTKIAAEYEVPLTKASLSDVSALIGQIMVKAGARHSAADMEHLQAAHDHLCSLGADCATDKSFGGDLNKGVKDQLTEALERIKKLEAQPMPSVVTLRMSRPVTKAEDNANRVSVESTEIDPNTLTLDKDDQRVFNHDGSVDEFSSRLMKARRLQAAAR